MHATEAASVEIAARTEAAPAVTSRTQHIDGFDLVRVFSAFNVVLFHVLAVRNGLWGRGSVIAFVMIAAALPAMRPHLGPFGKYARRRAHRILLPWAFWSAVYGSIAAARYYRSGTNPGWNWSTLLIGTCEHLWFFVYIFVVSLAIWGFLRVFDRVAISNAATGLSLVAGIMILLNAHYPPFFDGVPPLGIWWRCVPAVFLGIAFGLAQRLESQRDRSRIVLFASGATLAAAVIAGLTGSATTMVSFGIPGILLPLALIVPWKRRPVVEFIADVAMGIYATHPLMLLAVRHFWGDTLSPVVSAPAVFLGALALSKAIKRIPGGRLLV